MKKASKRISELIQEKRGSFFLIGICCIISFAHAQSSSVSSRSKKLPQRVFIQIMDSVSTMVINDATAFRHIDLPVRLIPNFNSYIKDSAVSNIKGLKSKVYYAYTMKDGQILNGDIYWNDTKSYIVFSIHNSVFVNYFSTEGVEQLKKLFKF